MNSIGKTGDWSNFTVVSEYFELSWKKTWKCLKNAIKTDFEALKHVCPSTENTLKIYFRFIDRYWPPKMLLWLLFNNKSRFGNIKRQICIYSVNYSLNVCRTVNENLTFLLEMCLFDVGEMKNVACILAFLMMSQFVYSLSILPIQSKSAFPKPPENWNSSYPLFWLVMWTCFYHL